MLFAQLPSSICFQTYQISGELDIVKDALIQVSSRLRANLFEREGAASAFVPVLPYLPMATDSDTLKHESRVSRRHGHSYSAGYGGMTELPRADGYGSYSSIQVKQGFIPFEQNL